MDGWRRKISEFEADLYRVRKPSFLGRLLGLRTKGGEMEVKKFDNGEKEMEVELYGLGVPDGAVVSVVIDAAATCEIRINRGRGRLFVGAAQEGTIPEVSAGSAAEIQYLGEALLKGTFEPD